MKIVPSGPVSNSTVCRVSPIATPAQAEPQIGTKQCLAGDYRRSAENYILELGDRKQRLADIIIADIIGQYIDVQ
jgi:hypothetical protein